STAPRPTAAANSPKPTAAWRSPPASTRPSACTSPPSSRSSRSPATSSTRSSRSSPRSLPRSSKPDPEDMINADRLKKNWSLVAANGEQVPLYFYSTLFLTHPEVRDMFPMNMAGQRDKLVTALGPGIRNADAIDRVLPHLEQLGRDHRKFGALREHYPAVGQALLATLEHFSGPHWTPAVASDWSAAYDLVAQIMADAADAA